MLTFIVEFFLVFGLIFQLICNTLITTSQNYNFPIIEKETLNQTILMLVWIIILLVNLEISANSFNGLFLNDWAVLNIKLQITVFSFALLYIILPVFKTQNISFFEFFSFFLFSLLSFFLITSAANLMVFYLTVEMQVLCFLVITTFSRNSTFSTEAGLKYFVVSSFMSSILLFGLFLIYNLLGTLNLAEIFSLLSYSFSEFNMNIQNVVGLGILLVTAALLFKIACAPFHSWAPDVYEGAPISSTLIIAIIPKISLVFFFMKWLFSLALFSLTVKYLLLFCGTLSCFFGTFFSLYQFRVKRLLVYSSIAQVGFIVSGLALASLESFTATLLFLVIYIVTSILIWGHFSVFYYFEWNLVNTIKTSLNVFSLNSFSGFHKNNKLWALSVVIIFFSVGGIPPFTGFLAKIIVLVELVNTHHGVFAFFLVLISAISVFYYIRVIKVLFFEPSIFKKSSSKHQAVSINSNLKTVYFIFTLLLFFLIITLFYPSTVYLVCQKIILNMVSLLTFFNKKQLNKIKSFIISNASFIVNASAASSTEGGYLTPSQVEGLGLFFGGIITYMWVYPAVVGLIKYYSTRKDFDPSSLRVDTTRGPAVEVNPTHASDVSGTTPDIQQEAFSDYKLPASLDRLGTARPPVRDIREFRLPGDPPVDGYNPTDVELALSMFQVPVLEINHGFEAVNSTDLKTFYDGGSPAWTSDHTVVTESVLCSTDVDNLTDFMVVFFYL